MSITSSRLSPQRIATIINRNFHFYIKPPSISKMYKPALIILEGNISAGKTSLSRDLGKLLGYHVFLEPTITNPYLEKFYADPPKYALTMQIWLLKQRFRTYISALKYAMEQGKGVILDRSIFSDWVFAEKNRRDKNITEEGYAEYLHIRQQLLAHLPTALTIYLDVSPQECHRRVHNLRGRDCEAGIPLDYLIGLDECYHIFLDMMRDAGSKVVKIPWNSFGNSNHVAQMVRASAGSVISLESAIDVEALSRYVNENPLVRSVMDQEQATEEETADLERRLLEHELANSSSPSTSPSSSSPQSPHGAKSSTPRAANTNEPMLSESPVKVKKDGAIKNVAVTAN